MKPLSSKQKKSKDSQFIQYVTLSIKNLLDDLNKISNDNDSISNTEVLVTIDNNGFFWLKPQAQSPKLTFYQ